MNAKNNGPVNPMLIVGAASVVVAGLLVLGHFVPLSPGTLYGTLLLLVLIAG